MIRAKVEPIGPDSRPTGMLRRILAVVAFSSLVTVAAPVTQVLACSCIQLAEGQALANADAAWVGVVTAVDNPNTAQPDQGPDPVRYTFAVEEMLKGELAISIDVRSQVSSASCGQEFALAQRWRVFAFADEKGQLQTGLCSGDELLGEGVPAPTPTPAGPPTALLVAIGAMIALAAISAWAFTRRGRAASA